MKHGLGVEKEGKLSCYSVEARLDQLENYFEQQLVEKVGVLKEKKLKVEKYSVSLCGVEIETEICRKSGS